MLHLVSWLLLALAGQGCTALIRSAKDPQPPPAYPIGTTNETFAKPVGTLFEMNGKVEYFSGCNAWWLGHLTKNEDVDIAMKQIADTKYKIIRVWGFGDVTNIPNAQDPNGGSQTVWYHLHNKTGNYINYDKDGLQRLDYVVSTAERLGLKLVLPFINNWQELGGINLYESVYGVTTDFYSNKKAQEVYQSYIKVLVERYKSSPAIFSWQLCNEPRCPSCSTDKTILGWANTTSRYIKSLDPKHMVSLGDEGWFGEKNGYKEADGTSSLAYQSHEGNDFMAYMNLSTLDYGTFHLYPATWAYPMGWGNHWIRQHADAAMKTNKPVVLEEYGHPNRDNHSIVATWQDTLLKVPIAADQVWQFGPANLSVDPQDFGDEFSIYYDKPEFQQLARKQAEAMLNKKV